MLFLLAFLPVIGANFICNNNTTERVLKDKVVIVTGAAKGIGYAIAENLLEQQVKVVIILDINKKKGMETEATFNAKFGHGRAVFIECDITTDLEEVSDYILEKYGCIELLVNNVGIMVEDNPRKTLVTNAIAPIEWSLKLWQAMRVDKGGCLGGTIINIDSTLGFFMDPFIVTYKASKFALMGFTKALGHEYNYNRTCVRVMALCPGYTYTDMTRQQMVWDEHLDIYYRFIEQGPRQSADAVGKAAVQIFYNADSATSWHIDGGVLEEAPISLYIGVDTLEAARDRSLAE